MSQTLEFKKDIQRKFGHDTAFIAGVDAHTTLSWNRPGLTGTKTAQPLKSHRPDMRNAVMTWMTEMQLEASNTMDTTESPPTPSGRSDGNDEHWRKRGHPDTGAPPQQPGTDDGLRRVTDNDGEGAPDGQGPLEPTDAGPPSIAERAPDQSTSMTFAAKASSGAKWTIDPSEHSYRFCRGAATRLRRPPTNQDIGTMKFRNALPAYNVLNSADTSSATKTQRPT